ncbi:SPASM domain-containing protein [Azospirillum melinis]
MSQREQHAVALLYAGRYADLFSLIVSEAALIEAEEYTEGLRPWFDIRGVTAFLNRVLDKAGERRGQLHRDLLASHPNFRPGLVAAAIHAMEIGDHATAIPLLERAMAPRPDDLFVQDLLAEAHLAITNGASRGGQAHPENWQGRHCHAPFEHFEPIDNGAVFVCCPTHVPFSIGNIYEQSIEEIWNSPTAQAIRGSILDGSFRYCSKFHCDRLLNGTLPKAAAAKPQRHVTKVELPPNEVVLNHDRSCNLACPSCRTEMIVADERDRERLDTVRADLVSIVEGAERVVITNSGDPFASKHYRGILQDIRPRADQWLKLYTNAQLFTPREWERLNHLHAINVWVDVSIDAAQPETYEVVRRGGSFERLENNLAYLADLRRCNAIKRLWINMTVQSCNFREMVSFVDWGLRLSVDRVYFLRLRNWGTFEVSDYLDRDVCAPTHTEHAEFLHVLKHPKLCLPQVDLGTLPRS